MSKSVAETFELIETLRGRGEDFCVVTVVRTADATSAKAGAKAVVTADGTLHGFVGGGCVTGAVKRVALEVLAAGAPRLIRVKPKESVVAPVDVDGVELHRSSCPSGGTVDLFLEPMRHRPRLVVCGLSPVAETLVKLGLAMGYHTVVAAPEGAARTPGLAGDLRSGFELSDLALDRHDAVVVATQGTRDREALKAALASRAGYVGMVGSRRKIGRLVTALSAEISPEQLARLHGPAGLPIGAIEPEEIALSVLGEIVQLRRTVLRKGAADGAGGAVRKADAGAR